MRKNLIFIFMLLLIATIFFYIGTNPKDIKKDAITPSTTPIPNLLLAYEGSMDKTKAVVGENAGQYIVEPADISYFLGGLVIKYDDIILFTNGYLDEKNNNDPIYGDVVIIANEEAYGVKKGMSMEEVKEILGEPDLVEDYSNYSQKIESASELFGTNTTFSYYTGDYEVIIEFHEESKKVILILLSGQKNNLGYPTSK